MTSEELNKAISNICNRNKEINFECWVGSGKPIPYIGWFWRNVNFDSENYLFGVIPKNAENNDDNLIGFMENNKWDYPYVSANEKEWEEIKRLLVIAVEELTIESFKLVCDEIQKLSVKCQGSIYENWDKWGKE